MNVLLRNKEKLELRRCPFILTLEGMHISQSHTHRN